MSKQLFAAIALLSAVIAVEVLMSSASPARSTEEEGKESVRTNRYGDPLPKGAVMRLGHETATGKRLNPAPESESRILQIEYAPDGKLLAVWREDGTIELWDTMKWQKATTLRSKDSHFGWMAFAPNGKYLTTTEGYFDHGKYQGIIRHWDPQTGKLQNESPPRPGWLEKLAYSADGRILACQQPSNVILWDTATDVERGRILVQDLGGGMPRLSPDGRILACASPARAVVLWDVKSGESIRGFGKSEPGYRELIRFAPDGRTIATTGGRRMEAGKPIRPDVLLWETASGQERLHIAQNEGQVAAIAYSPSGRLLASVGRTETIHLWDAWTGKEVRQFTGHRGAIRSLFFAPDGKTLASGGADTNVLIWDVSGFSPAVEVASAKMNRDELEKGWNDLAGIDAAAAYRTIGELNRHPDQAVRLIEAKLATHPGMQAKRLAQLIAELDNDDFKARQSASRELANLGRLAEGALKKTLEGKPAAEVKRRVQDLLSKLDRNQDNPTQRQLLRAIVVLERLGTPQARRLLGKLATEATEPDLAREAKTSLQRLSKAGPP